jgi:hypothetical protein
VCSEKPMYAVLGCGVAVGAIGMELDLSGFGSGIDLARG